MPFPLPANTSFYMTKRELDSDYTMPTLEASSDYYEVGYILSGDRLTITPDCSYALNAGSVGTMPPFSTTGRFRSPMHPTTPTLSSSPRILSDHSRTLSESIYWMKFIRSCETILPMPCAAGFYCISRKCTTFSSRIPPWQFPASIYALRPAACHSGQQASCQPRE